MGLTSGVWTGGALLIHLVIIRECRKFLDETLSTAANLRSWCMRFIMLDLFFGMARTSSSSIRSASTSSPAPSCCSSS
jgi:two-component system cell cycle sensor histidine kinase PleC